MSDLWSVAAVTQLFRGLSLLSPQPPPTAVLVHSRTHSYVKKQFSLQMFTDDSGLREAVLQLTDTVLQLKGAVEKLANKEEDPDEIHTGVAEEEGWETARDTLQDQTKETLDIWKDELNNLLVFAGLFSAVVTAFTVESYTWLQQDPGDISNTLLAQISMQLSAFTFGSTFLNSTSSALPLASITASFSPVSYAVSVNTLWVLSLTLSLISAFFAITAQQWLRQLRLPPDMPVRMAIRLMAVRSDALQAWQVPSIISLLPLLLQVAVIFFLIGLFLLLQALNATVAVAFGIVTLVGLIAFLATTLIPLIAISCPYKSPVIPTGAILLQSLTYPLALAVSPAILGLKVMLQQLPEFIRIRQRYSTTSSDMFFDYSRSGMQDPLFRDRTIALKLVLAVGAFYEFSLISYIKSFGRHMFVDLGRFWLSREYQYLNSQKDDEHERSSLVSVLLAAPSRSFSKVVPCLRGAWYKYYIAKWTVERSLRAIVPQQHDVIDEWGQLEPEAKKPHARKWLSSRHRRLLWRLLRQRDWTQDREVATSDGHLLTLFNDLDGAEFVTPRRFIKHLLHVCHNQDISKRCYFWEARPACLLLHLIQSSSYVLDEQDVEGLHQFVSRVFNHNFAVNRHTCQLVLGSGTLLLHALNSEGAARSYHLLAAVLSALSANLNKDEAVAKLPLLIQYSYEDPDASPEYMHMSRMILGFCSVAAQYYSSHFDLVLVAYSLSRISAVLRSVCSHSDYERKPEMLEARGLLDTIDNNIGTVHVSTGWELLVEGWDGYLAALVIAQDMERVTEESILEPAMKGLLIAESRLSSLAALDGINDANIDQHANSSATVSWKALGRCTRAFKIASAMPPPVQMNHSVDEGVAEEDPRSLS